MNKFYDTLTNTRGDILSGYSVQVVDSSGALIDIFADNSGTRFTDASGNVVNYAVADDTTGLAQFYWTAAEGQSLQILDPQGNLARPPIVDFANNYVFGASSTEVQALRDETETFRDETAAFRNEAEGFRDDAEREAADAILAASVATANANAATASASAADASADAALVAQTAAEAAETNAALSETAAEAAADLAQSYGAMAPYKTWTALSAVTGAAGDFAMVISTDTGTHTDPVATGTVDNAGIYAWSASPAGWERVDELPAILAQAWAEGTEPGGVSTKSAKEWATEAQTTVEAIRWVETASNAGPGVTGEGDLGLPGLIRFSHYAPQPACELLSVRVAFETSGNAYVYIGRRLSETSIEILARHYGAMDAGINTITAADFGLTEDLPEGWFVGIGVGTGGPNYYCFFVVDGSSIYSLSGGVPDVDDTITVDPTPNYPPQWDATYRTGQLGEEIVTNRQRIEDVALFGGIDLSSANNYDLRLGIPNYNAVWDVPGPTKYVRQPHMIRIPDDKVILFVEGRDGVGADSDPSKGVLRVGSIGSDGIITWDAAASILMEHFTVYGGTTYEDALGNFSSFYDDRKDCLVLLARKRHVDAALATPLGDGTIKNEARAFFYSFAEGRWIGAGDLTLGLGLQPAAPFDFDDGVDMEYIFPLGEGRPPNGAGIQKKLDPAQGECFIPWRYLEAGQQSGDRILKVLRFKHPYVLGDPEPFVETLDVGELMGVNPGTGIAEQLQPSESTMIELPSGAIYIASRNDKSGVKGTTEFLIAGTGDALLATPRLSPMLHYQEMTRSAVSINLGDRGKWHAFLGCNTDSESVSSNSRGGIAVFMATALDDVGWPIWGKNTGPFLGATETVSEDMAGNNVGAVSYASVNNAVTLCNLTIDPDNVIAGMAMDKRALTPGGVSTYVATPYVRVKPANCL